jgi:hypothetical protein
LQTWCHVEIQERDLHVGCDYKLPNYYGLCDLCGSSFGDFTLWRTSIETRIKHKHNVCHDCAETMAQAFSTEIDRMIGTGLKSIKSKSEE